MVWSDHVFNLSKVTTPDRVPVDQPFVFVQESDGISLGPIWQGKQIMKLVSQLQIPEPNWFQFDCLLDSYGRIPNESEFVDVEVLVGTGQNRFRLKGNTINIMNALIPLADKEMYFVCGFCSNFDSKEFPPFEEINLSDESVHTEIWWASYWDCELSIFPLSFEFMSSAFCATAVCSRNETLLWRYLKSKDFDSADSKQFREFINECYQNMY